MGEAMSADHADHLPTIFSIDGRQSNPAKGKGVRRLPTMPTIFFNKCIRNNNWVLPHHPMWIYVTFWNRWSAGIKNGSNPYAARSVAADHLFEKMVGISGGSPPRGVLSHQQAECSRGSGWVLPKTSARG